MRYFSPVLHPGACSMHSQAASKANAWFMMIKLTPGQFWGVV